MHVAVNTMTTKSIKLLNVTNLIPTFWSLHCCIVRSTSTAYVPEMLWRASLPYKTSQDVYKALLAILPVWTLFSPTIVCSPTTPTRSPNPHGHHDDTSVTSIKTDPHTLLDNLLEG